MIAKSGRRAESRRAGGRLRVGMYGSGAPKRRDAAHPWDHSGTFPSIRMNAAATRTLFALLLFSPLARSQPLLHVSGGITLNGVAQPLLFTWNSSVPVTGAGWAPNEPVQIVLHGPLDSPGVHPRSAGPSARLAAAAVAEAASARGGRTVFGRIPRPVV